MLADELPEGSGRMSWVRVSEVCSVERCTHTINHPRATNPSAGLASCLSANPHIQLADLIQPSPYGGIYVGALSLLLPGQEIVGIQGCR
jgi:hypothetical protein